MAGVQVAAVVPVPDPVYGEVGHAFVVASADEAGLRAQAREVLASCKVPKRFHLVDELPLLPVGKVDKEQLRAMATQRRGNRGVSTGSAAHAPAIVRPRK